MSPTRQTRVRFSQNKMEILYNQWREEARKFLQSSPKLQFINAQLRDALGPKNLGILDIDQEIFFVDLDNEDPNSTIDVTLYLTKAIDKSKLTGQPLYDILYKIHAISPILRLPGQRSIPNLLRQVKWLTEYHPEVHISEKLKIIHFPETYFSFSRDRFTINPSMTLHIPKGFITGSEILSDSEKALQTQFLPEVIKEMGKFGTDILWRDLEQEAVGSLVDGYYINFIETREPGKFTIRLDIDHEKLQNHFDLSTANAVHDTSPFAIIPSEIDQQLKQAWERFKQDTFLRPPKLICLHLGETKTYFPEILTLDNRLQDHPHLEISLIFSTYLWKV